MGLNVRPRHSHQVLTTSIMGLKRNLANGLVSKRKNKILILMWRWWSNTKFVVRAHDECLWCVFEIISSHWHYIHAWLEKTPMSICIHCTPLTFLKVLSTTHFEDVGETLDKDRTSNHKPLFQKRSVVNNNLLSGRCKDDMGYWLICTCATN